jgi:hypothetical protein
VKDQITQRKQYRREQQVRARDIEQTADRKEQHVTFAKRLAAKRGDLEAANLRRPLRYLTPAWTDAILLPPARDYADLGMRDPGRVIDREAGAARWRRTRPFACRGARLNGGDKSDPTVRRIPTK